MTENQRLKILQNELGFKSQLDFAVALGMKQGSLSDVMRGKGGVGVSDAIKFKLENLYRINKDWLETGEGDIYLEARTKLHSPQQEQTFYKALPPRIEVSPISLHPHKEDDPTGVAKYVYAADGTAGMRVKIVPIKAQAGYLLGYGDPEYYEDFDTELILVDKEHAGTYLGFEVKGDSMITTDPEKMRYNIYPGWIAIGRDLPRQKWAYKLHTHSYDYWIIVHKTDGILIKEISKHDVQGGKITIHSLNPEFEDKEISLEDVEQIFSVVQMITKTKR